MTATVQKVEVIPLKGIKLLCDDGDSVEINFDMPRQEVRQKIKEKVGVEPKELEQFGTDGETSDLFGVSCSRLRISYDKKQIVDAIGTIGGYVNIFDRSFFETSFEDVESCFLELDPQTVNMGSEDSIYSPSLRVVAQKSFVLICTESYWNEVALSAGISEQKGGGMNV